MKFLQSKKNQLYIIIATCLLLNINTITNQYALDDEMVIKKNMYVQQGFGGIANILSTDAYKSYFNFEGADNTNLSGGRFRPLSIVSFAIEQAIFGKTMGNKYLEERDKLLSMEQSTNNANDIEVQRVLVKNIEKSIDAETLKLAPIRHIFQIIYFTICCLLLYWLITLLPYKNNWFAFVTTILFAIHPIHTEVVANIKSRDEIFSLSFILLTCIYYIRFWQSPKNTKLAWLAFLFYLLAFLSKEYAFALAILLPAYYYTTQKTSIVQMLKANWFLGFAFTTIVLFGLRYIIIQAPKTEITDVLNNPYLFAKSGEILPSKIVTWLKYLQLLFFPYKLSSDYSYNTFPYVSFTNFTVIISTLIWVGIALCTAYTVIKRKFIGFALTWLLVFFLMINNLLFDIGATMGERLIFHPSVAFCGIIGFVAVNFFGKSNSLVTKFCLQTFFVIVVLAGAYKTILRNCNWKNDYTLFTTDANNNVQSAMLQSNAGSQYFSKALEPYDGKVMTATDSLTAKPLLQKALLHSTKAISIYPRHINSHTNVALIYWYLNNFDSAIVHWQIAANLFKGRNQALSRHAIVLLNKGLTFGSQKNYTQAIKMMEAASTIDMYNPSIWNNLGGAYFMTQNFALAATAFTKALQLNPNLQDAKNGLNAAKYQLSLQKK